MTPPEVTPSAFKLARSAYGFASVLAVFSFIPAFNALFYSAHGGPGWLLLPFALPYALVRLALAYRRAAPERRPFIRRFGISSVLVYTAASCAASFIGANAINAWSGLNIEPTQMWALYMSPVGLLYLFI